MRFLIIGEKFFDRDHPVRQSRNTWQPQRCGILDEPDEEVAKKRVHQLIKDNKWRNLTLAPLGDDIPL